VIFDGGFFRKIAVIHSGTVSWYGVTFYRGGDSTSTGGGCLSIPSNNSIVGLYNCTFLECISTSYYGGGLYSKGTLKMDSCIFLNCQASYGGAISLYGESSVNNSRFTDNSAYISGGAMLINSNSTVTLQSAFFQNNLAPTDAGAIWANHTYRLNLNSTIFLDNQVNQNGGGLYVSSIQWLTISNSYFLGGLANWGAGVYIETNNHSTVNIVDTSFYRNHVFSNGGAIYLGGNIDLKLSNCEIWDNWAYQGGAIYCSGNKYYNPDNIHNTLFANNTGLLCEDNLFSGNCTGFFSTCALHETTTNCDLCDGANCFVDTMNSAHCFAQTQDELCYCYTPPFAPVSVPTTVQDSLPNYIVGLGILLGLLSIFAIFGVAKICHNQSKTNYDEISS